MRNVTVDAVFGTTQDVERRVVSLDVTQGSGRHELAVVTVAYANNSLRGLWADGTPLRVVHGLLPRTSTFYGYVVGHQVVPRADDTRSQYTYVEYLALGTSSPMQSTRTRAWQDITASSVARAVAREYGMVPIIDRHPRRIAYRAQAGQSDFRFLTELADEAGYDFTVLGPYLRFTDPARSLDVLTRSVPTLTMNRYVQQPDTLFDFSPSVGALIPDGGLNAARVANVLLADGNVLALQNGNSGTVLAATNQPLGSYSEAVDVLTADALRNRNWETAKARCVGDSRLLPGTPVNIAGNAVAPQHAGAWAVSKAVHRYELSAELSTQSTYYAYLDLHRDKQRDLSVIPIERGVVRAPVAMTLYDGIWRPDRVEASYAA